MTNSPRYEADRRGVFEISQTGAHIAIAWAEHPALAHRIADALNGSEALVKAANELLYEFGQYYDVDDGIGNISGDIMVKVDALRAILPITKTAQVTG